MNVNTSRPVIQLTADGKFVTEHASIADAAKAVNSAESRISYCCRGMKNAQTVKGFRFVFKSDYDPKHDYSYTFNENRKAIIQCDLDGNELKRYPSIKEAAAQFEAPSTRYRIGKCCNGKAHSCNGYKWTFAKEA